MMTLQQKLRAGHVRRWHIVAVAREQTVADHMHRVGVIAEEILRILGMFNWSDNLTLNVMRFAAIHDRHEFLLGDIPTPGKVLIADENKAPNNPIEDAACTLDPEYSELVECFAQYPLAGMIVKYADILEALNYVGIWGFGSHARQVWSEMAVLAVQACATLVDHCFPNPGDKGDFDMTVKRLFNLIEELKEDRNAAV